LAVDRTGDFVARAEQVVAETLFVGERRGCFELVRRAAEPVELHLLRDLEVSAQVERDEPPLTKDVLALRERDRADLRQRVEELASFVRVGAGLRRDERIVVDA